MPKIKEPVKSQRKLEDYQPGASRSEIFHALKKVVTSPKPSQKHGSRPEKASS